MRPGLLAAGVTALISCGGSAPVASPGPPADAAADAASDDAGVVDMAAADVAPARTPAPPLDQDGVTWRLSETGLYADLGAGTLAAGVVEFSPRYQLWADGAEKRRFIALPPGTSIDTGDMDHWRFPVGTRVWKEFRRNGVPLETRLIERTGPGDGESDYWMASFQWQPDGQDAVLAPDGARAVAGTDHDIPAKMFCASCHASEPGRILGFSAIQMSGAPANPGLSALAARGWLSRPPTADLSPPGDPAVRDTLGLLHANCGTCHSTNGIALPKTDMILRLSVTEREPAATAIYRTTLGAPVSQYHGDPFLTRVVPGAPLDSALLGRMLLRDGGRRQMPPLASKHPDEVGGALVRRWIEGL
jgi:hypothetical protein